MPGRAARRRAPAVHPLHVGLDGEAEGHPAHDRRLPDAASPTRTRYVFDLKPEEDVYWCTADVGWVTGHSYIVYGPLANGATSVMYEGAPDYPDKDIWWELFERYGVTIFYTAPTAIRACMKWGAEYPEQARPLVAAAARHGRRADQPEGVALVPQGDRRRALPDRRHLVADRDRRDHDHAAAGRARRPSPARRAGRCRASRPASSTSDGKDAGTEQGLLVLERPWPGMLRTLYREDDRFVETYWSKFGRRPTSSATPPARDEDGYFWIIGRIDDVINVSGHRMSTAEIESAIVSLPEGRRGGRDRPGGRGHGPGGRRRS